MAVIILNWKSNQVTISSYWFHNHAMAGIMVKMSEQTWRDGSQSNTRLNCKWTKTEMDGPGSPDYNSMIKSSILKLSHNLLITLSFSQWIKCLQGPSQSIVTICWSLSAFCSAECTGLSFRSTLHSRLTFIILKIIFVDHFQQWIKFLQGPSQSTVSSLLPLVAASRCRPAFSSQLPDGLGQGRANHFQI